jgi:hypothetical protein
VEIHSHEQTSPYTQQIPYQKDPSPDLTEQTLGTKLWKPYFLWQSHNAMAVPMKISINK